MKCPFCQVPDSKVIDSRSAEEGGVIRRRRECESCTKRFTTYERVEDTLPTVVKKDGRRELFDRRKIHAGVVKACEKRPIPMDKIEALVERVERWGMEQERREVDSALLGERVMEELRALDQVAYVRFASVYRSFKDIGEFMNELTDIIARNP